MSAFSIKPGYDPSAPATSPEKKVKVLRASDPISEESFNRQAKAMGWMPYISSRTFSRILCISASQGKSFSDVQTGQELVKKSGLRMNFLTPCCGFFVNFHDGADNFFNPFVEEIYRGDPGTHDC